MGTKLGTCEGVSYDMKDQPTADQQHVQMWGVLLYAIGGGHPALTLFKTKAEAEADAQRWNFKEDWVASVKEYQVADGLFDDEPYLVVLRPAQLMERAQERPRNEESATDVEGQHF